MPRGFAAPGARDVVLPERVAAVDDGVAFRHQTAKFLHRLRGRLPRRHHQPDHARGLQPLDQVLQGRGRRRAFPAERQARIEIGVEHHAFDAHCASGGGRYSRPSGPDRRSRFASGDPSSPSELISRRSPGRKNAAESALLNLDPHHHGRRSRRVWVGARHREGERIRPLVSGPRLVGDARGVGARPAGAACLLITIPE